MSRDERFTRLSPGLGQLDELVFDELYDEDPDAAIELVARLAQSTDRELAVLARKLAGRLSLQLANSDRLRSQGAGRLGFSRANDSAGDIDIDRSLDGILSARAARQTPNLEDLVVSQWQKPATAICLLVDRSGSMDGNRLACAALSAAACSWRAPDQFAVLAFSDRVIELKALDVGRRPEAVVADLLALKGHGTTDLRLALTAASRQFARCDAKRQLTVLLSDAEVTAGSDPVPVARRLKELAIVAPAEDADHARRLAESCGSRIATVDRPRSVLSALRMVMK